jgi:hypothetical protein
VLLPLTLAVENSAPFTCENVTDSNWLPLAHPTSRLPSLLPPQQFLPGKSWLFPLVQISNFAQNVNRYKRFTVPLILHGRIGYWRPRGTLCIGIWLLVCYSQANPSS